MGRKDIYKDAVPFTSENQPENRGRPKGSKNRSTVLKKWLLAEIDLTNPITRLKERGTVEDEVVLAWITKARQGDMRAIKELLDTMYGKVPEKVEFKVSDAAKEALQTIMAETGLPEDKARQIVAARFGVTEQELISTEVM